MDLAQRLTEIHTSITSGSRTASRDLFVTALSPLRGYLANNFRTLTADDWHDLATDAILAYIADPDRFELQKSSLWSYLCMIARNDAMDLVRKRDNRERLLDEKVETDVEFWAARAKDGFSGEDSVDARHIMKRFGNRLVTSEVESRVLALILNDEKETGEFAIALGIDPAGIDVKRTVKQAKDRMLLRMKRLRDEL